MDVKSCTDHEQYPTERSKIRAIFKRYYGSAKWASDQTGVHEGTISRWLKGHKVSKLLDATMPPLAQRLKDTRGACIKEGRE